MSARFGTILSGSCLVADVVVAGCPVAQCRYSLALSYFLGAPFSDYLVLLLLAWRQSPSRNDVKLVWHTAEMLKNEKITFYLQMGCTRLRSFSSSEPKIYFECLFQVNWYFWAVLFIWMGNSKHQTLFIRKMVYIVGTKFIPDQDDIENLTNLNVHSIQWNISWIY